MKLTEKACNKCGKTAKVVETDNKLVGSICLDCISKAIDFNDVNDLKMLSETLKIAFNPNQFYLAQMNANTELEALESYFEYLQDKEDYDIDPKDGKVSNFDKINEEWDAIKNYHSLLLAIPTFRKEFEERNRVKWGFEYSFEELIRLENLYTSTLKTYNIDDPVKRDAIKKAAVISMEIDNRIKEGDVKVIKDFTTAYQNLLKIAGIDQIANTAAEDGTIRTVSDLVAYVEKRGFKVQSDFVEKKDIVDMTLDNILENTKLIISEKTGVDVEMRDIVDKAQGFIEEEIAAEVYEREAITNDVYEEAERMLEEELSKEEDNFDIDDVSFLGG